MKIPFLNLVLLILPFAFSSCGYNAMVEKREKVASAWAQVENVYQRRADLIPNLVNTVKGYATHERETFESIVKARAQATSINLSVENLTPENLQKFEQAQQSLSSSLGRLMAIAENYPQLRASDNFLQLQAQLEGTENRIAVERRHFNEAVRDYNTYIEQIPQKIVADWFGFEKKGYFEMRPGAEEVPEVNF